MSDERAFSILSRPRWNRGAALHSDAQRELKRGVRVDRFVRQHREGLNDPMAHDIVGWDKNLAVSSPWPWCHKCKSIVVEYGKDDENDKRVVIYAKCHGNSASVEIVKPSRDITKRDPNWLRRSMRNLVFFAA